MGEKGIPLSPGSSCLPVGMACLPAQVGLDVAHSKASRNLACAVIHKAIHDLTSVADRERESAQRFLLRPNGGLSFWAKEAGLDPGRITKKMRERKR